MKLRLLFIIPVLLVATACNKLLEFPPEDVILAEDALQSPEDMQRLLNSCYDVLANIFDGRQQNVAELLSDNLAEPETNLDYIAVFNRETNFFTPSTNGLYADYYFAIYRCNILLESFDLIEGLSDAERTRIEAEARFIRGLCHSLCLQLYARPAGWSAGNQHLGIVVKTNSDAEPLPRGRVDEAYLAVVEDFEFAMNNLPTANGAYATKWSAAGALANTHFLLGNYEQAVFYAGEVINSGAFSLEPTIFRFKQDEVSSESVFGTVGSLIDNRSETLRDNYNGTTPTLLLSSDFATLMSFTPSDARNAWLEGAINPAVRKFYDAEGNAMEYFNVPVISLTELHLVRAEAIGELIDNGGSADLSVAIADVNAIRDRAFGAGMNPLASDATAQEVIEAARIEYRKETICEGKWQVQLKRRGAIEGEDIEVRGAPYDCPGMSIQFPNNETTVAGFQLNEEGGC
ncbi:MAG: RagB/SusD family nutrient uptake outer membrane protein [Flavobacteriales bacterium]